MSGWPAPNAHMMGDPGREVMGPNESNVEEFSDARVVQQGPEGVVEEYVGVRPPLFYDRHGDSRPLVIPGSEKTPLGPAGLQAAVRA